MRLLREHFLPLPADAFAAQTGAGTLPEHAVCVTFDDGYADNWHVAFPIMAKHGIPACIFVATGLVERGRESSWDSTERILNSARPPNGAITLEDVWGRLCVECPDADEHSLRGWNIEQPVATRRQQTYLDLLGWMHGRPEAQLEPHLRRLHAWVGLDLCPRPDRRFLTVDELRTVAAQPAITLGGHTVNHPLLSLLPEREQLDEIAGSRRQLAELTGRAPTLFAYPYGTSSDYTPATVRAVARAGYQFAFANMPARVRRAAPFEIPRVLVRDWDLETFSAQLGL
jgi:peptidoglycan/xylan/chitin deacetylase (PgdA/CDA1 family)